MQYLFINYLVHEEDDPVERYVELDDSRRERRRMDVYQNGMWFAYGGDHGWPEALAQEPYPEHPYNLNRVGEVEVRVIERDSFEAFWYQLPERPSGFMGTMF